MKKKLWVAYFVALHLVLLVVAFDWLTVRAGRKPAPADHQIQQAHRGQARMDQTVPAGATIFLGDSLTADLVTAAVTTNPVNFSVGGQYSSDLLASIEQLQSLRRAARVVVLVGTNDVTDRQEGLAQRYDAILAKLPASVPVFMHSIPPLEKPAAPELAEIAREAGASARRACAARPGCVFVDLWAALTHDGKARPGVLQEDGIHLTAAGYELWIALLRQALVAKPGSPG